MKINTTETIDTIKLAQRIARVAELNVAELLRYVIQTEQAIPRNVDHAAEIVALAAMIEEEIGNQQVEEQEESEPVLAEIQSVLAKMSRSGNTPVWEIDTSLGRVWVNNSADPAKNSMGPFVDTRIGQVLIRMEIGKRIKPYRVRVRMIKDGDFWRVVEVLEPDDVPSNRVSAIEQARKWVAEPFLVLDTETTGLHDPYPVSIAIVSNNGDTLFDQRIALPEGVTIEAGATAVHGITSEMLAKAEPFNRYMETITQLLTQHPVIIYNADYDLQAIRRAYEMAGSTPPTVNSRCAMLLAAEYRGEKGRDGDYRWSKLTQIASELAIDTTGAHGAQADALMTLHVIKKIAKGEK